MMRSKLLILFLLMFVSLSSCSKTDSDMGGTAVNPPVSPVVTTAVTYYLDAVNGNDMNDGKSESAAWQTVSRASQQQLEAGSKLLLHCGDTFRGQLEIHAQGTAANPVCIGTYGIGEQPVVMGNDDSMYALRIYNSTYTRLENIDIVNTGTTRLAGRTGLKIEARDYGCSRNIHINHVTVRDVNGSLVKSQGGGSGILIVNAGSTVKSNFDSLQIENCHIVRCSRNAMIWEGYYDRNNWYPSTNTIVRNNLIEGVPGDGIVPIGCRNTLIEYNVMRDSPDVLPDTEAAAGIWPWSCDHTTVQYNEVCGHKAPWDSQGYDCDYNCRNTTIQYNYSHDNYGGLVLVCDNGSERSYSLGNQGSIVRYNISIGDAQRPKPTTRGIFSPNIHIAGRVQNTTIDHNIIHSNVKQWTKADRSMITSDSWDGYADKTMVQNNIFYTAEPSAFQLTESTANTFIHNWYFGTFENAPLDTEKQTASNYYQRQVTDIDSTGFTGLQKLMNVRTCYGVACYSVDKQKIEGFFQEMDR